jgi:DUF2075 family protein
MLAYCSTLQQFIEDVATGNIAQIIESTFRETFGRGTSPAEIRSWQNSLLALCSILNHPMFPETMGVGVEFQLPKTSKRIDVLLSGFNSEAQREVLIVELKQWATADRTSMDGVVETFLGGSLRHVSHPSYQAWSYAQLLTDFALVVGQENIDVTACAFLHNMADKSELEIAHYSNYTERAPIFTGLEGFAFQQFISDRIQQGDNGETIRMLEESDVAPSKSLADALSKMIEGNTEFTLLDEQKVTYERCLMLAEDLSSKQVMIVDGGPGTGKSVLAINLLSRFTGQGLNARYVTKNAAPRAVYEARLTGHLKKSRISTLFTGSGSFVSTNTNEYDMLIVDEAHRLGLKSGLYRNLGENQIKEIINGSKLSIFFIDELQKIHIHDAGSKSMIRAMAEELSAEVTETNLVSQFRCGGSNEFLGWLDTLLYDTAKLSPYSEDPDKFEFRVFDDPSKMHEAIRSKNAQGEKSRMVAGYCWDWVSKKKKDLNDIVLNNGDYAAQWNLTEHGSLWIEREESISEIGCIHTCQGLEVDYIGVIIGPDLRFENGELVCDVSQRAKTDASIKGIKKMSREDPEKAAALGKELILNTYRTLMTRGMKGCYVYCTDELLRTMLNKE